jgi:hypothetical protein
VVPGLFLFEMTLKVHHWLAVLLLSRACGIAQPTGAVYYVSLAGDDRNPGTVEAPWRHLEWAMTRPFLRGGDTIRVLGGVYRPEPGIPGSASDDALIRPVASGEPGRPILVTAETGHTVILSGRMPAVDWQPVGASAVSFHEYSPPTGFPFDHPFQVVEDGRLLFPVVSLDALQQPGQCFVDTAARRIYARTSDGLSPSDHVMEYGAAVSGVEFRKVSNWRLEGFGILGFRTSGIVIADGAGNIELNGINVSYAGAHRPGSDPTSGYALAVYDTSGGNRIRASRFHHTFAEAIHVSQSGAGGDVYEENEISDAGGPEWFRQDHMGRYLTGPGMIVRGDRITIRRNRFVRNGYHGLILESDLLGSEGPSRPSGNLVEGNVLCFNGGNGLFGDGKNGVALSAGNVIRFNLLCRNNQNRLDVMDGELRLAGNFRDTTIYNNTLYAERANGVALLAARAADGSAQGADAAPDGTRLLNNIVVHAAAVQQTYPLRLQGSAARVRLEANNWYRAGPGALARWETVQFESLEAFSNRTGWERQGFSVDPQFVSASNGRFELRPASPLLGQGMDVYEDGEPRPARGRRPHPDLGAFPYEMISAVP